MTSLLEALCGVDLPRGDGIQTRVPLVLQLRQAQEDEDEYAVIQVVKENVLGGNTKHEERIALGQIGNKVREYTAIAAGEGKNIVDVPIELKIFRKNQDDDLTLIDLPGITRVAIDDQAGGNGRNWIKNESEPCCVLPKSINIAKLVCMTRLQSQFTI